VPTSRPTVIDPTITLPVFPVDGHDDSPGSK
jgi:hypothetical protein